MSQRFCLFLSLLILFLGGCQKGNQGAADAYESLNESQSQVSELISADLLENSGLRIGWQSKMYVNNGETIQQMFIRENYLFMQTDSNFLYCLDRDSGKFKYGVELARPGLPVVGPQYYGNEMLFMAGNELIVVDIQFGTITSKKQLHQIGNGAIFPPVKNDDYIYVSGTTNRLYAISVKEGVSDFEVSSKDGAAVNSILADNETLVFSTVNGDIIRIENDKPKKVWRFQVGGIAAPLVRDDQWIYVSSLDRKLYKLSVNDGTASGWSTNFLAGESLKHSPRIGEDTVYQNAGVKGLYAIDKESGRKLWQLKGGFDLLSEEGSRTYVISKPSKLIAMDNVKGKKLFTINISDVSAHAVNTDDSTIYLASDDGRVVSIVRDEF